MVITVVVMGLTMALFGFHFYLSRILGKTTLEYLIPEDEEEEEPNRENSPTTETDVTDRDCKDRIDKL